jgi:predicted nucleotidyltransferase component of viral defense system
MISSAYRSQVDLLLQLLPYIGREETLALKGGTAINLFVRDMPRLSVDIDLHYLPLEGRPEALLHISQALARIKENLEAAIPDIRVRLSSQKEGQEARLICQLRQALVKVEVNTVMRGHLWPTRSMPLSQSAQDEFGKFAMAQVMSQAELFGGKICAALDRQHPRDLFDVHQLFSQESLAPDIRQGFVAALLGHSRPMHELLRPHFLDQWQVFETQFAGMTRTEFTYDQFESTRERLVAEIHAQLTDADRALLLSFKRGKPDWSLFPGSNLKDMPAVQWKLANIQKLKEENPNKHAQQLAALEKVL